MSACPSRFQRWLRATWLGWAVGLLLTVASAITADAVGLHGWRTWLGLAMGAGVGFLQSRAMRGTLANPRRWLVATVSGLTFPFLATDLARAAGLPIPYSLYLSVALGGLAAGLAQAKLLRTLVSNPWIWVPASVVGWALAASTVAAADVAPRALAIAGLPGAALYLGLVLLGGAILGVVTGTPLAKIPEAGKG